MKIKDFGVEMWMNKYEDDCEWNLAETCVKSFVLEELIELSGEPKEKVVGDMLKMHLTYGAILGSDRLRNQIAGLYGKAKKDNIVTTHGAIVANNLVLTSTVEPGDKVISVLPTYQQMYSIPESIGAEVSILQLR
ncbi:MAG: aminotransferase, partial [Clostridiales bacterium]